MKIQYKSEPLVIKSERRYLRYRIEPSELSWWNRTFKNPWRYVYKSHSTVFLHDNEINDCLCFLFSPKEAQEIVDKFNTYEKLIDFLKIEYDKASDKFYEAQEKFKKENTWNF